MGMMAAVDAVDLVVCAHHRGRALVEAALEMRQIDFTECAFVHSHIYFEAGVLDAVAPQL